MDELLQRADRTLGEYSAVLYGSMVRGDYKPGRSDLNLLLIAAALTPERLRAIGPALGAIEAEGQTPPLLFTDQEWRRAADVFPVEVTDMRLAYRVLRGMDPLTDLSVEAKDLRQSLEFEWRGKLLRLRQDFATHIDQPEALGRAVGATAGSIRVLLRASLVLAGRVPPSDDPELARQAAALADADSTALEVILSHRRDPDWRCDREVFERYLAALERLVHFVDHFLPGET